MGYGKQMAQIKNNCICVCEKGLKIKNNWNNLVSCGYLFVGKDISYLCHLLKH